MWSVFSNCVSSKGRRERAITIVEEKIPPNVSFETLMELIFIDVLVMTMKHSVVQKKHTFSYAKIDDIYDVVAMMIVHVHRLYSQNQAIDILVKVIAMLGRIQDVWMSDTSPNPPSADIGDLMVACYIRITQVRVQTSNNYEYPFKSFNSTRRYTYERCLRDIVQISSEFTEGEMYAVRSRLIQSS